MFFSPGGNAPGDFFCLGLHRLQGNLTTSTLIILNKFLMLSS